MRQRLSTTVDEELLERARCLREWPTDASMIDEALEALLKRHRDAEIDAMYEVYDRIPMSTPDEWGDLESFGEAVRAHRYGLSDDR